ncbi:PREDICTED: relaxin receptor 2-like isoform X2 [Nicrophorus vespilloides]|uniref:Relaxin receptor 2-like isoform X2 n=1 Tax=Nicrophorus vespilloides TaxID=110193 RepID=A0ABM1MAP8_NICVS|nr:PREDICTED: relaxin receptor 2-like isoform X2 [Nicrophorus vespilloides]
METFLVHFIFIFLCSVLQQCESRWIERGTFRSFTTLRKLHIDNNFIKILPDDVFAVNNSLEILTLRYNEISELHPQVFQQLGKLLELDLSNNELSSIDAATLQTLSRLTYLNLRGNKISLLGENNIPQFPFLSTLNLENNLLEYIVPGTFALTPQLQNLYLSRNKLRYLTNGTFDGLSRLLALTLVGNQIGGMDSNVFIGTGNLTSLDFRGNRFNKFDKKVLRSLQNLKHIYFDSFEMCIFAPHVRVCEPKSDGISSQEHLLDNLVLRTSVWIMASVGCVGNVMVLLGRFIGGPTNNVVHSLYIKNLALSDLLMGIYLFAIASVDYRYRGEYLQHQWRWRHSTLCNICGFLNTLSCESSVLILSLVTWDRFVSVTQPLARKQPSPRAASFTLIFLWTLAAIVATIPLTSVGEEYFGNDFYGSNGVCLPLYIHNPFAKGWLYSILLFICVNALALLFICYAYSRMIREIHKSTKACRSTQQSQDRDKVAQRFGIIVLTDCLCWVPVIIIKVAALSGMQPSETYHRFVYATLAIYVMPINSALNPILYTLTTTLFKKQIKRFFDSCLRSRRPCHSDGLHNSGCDSGYSHSLSLFPKRESARKILTYRGTQTSLTTTKNSSCKRPTAV